MNKQVYLLQCVIGKWRYVAPAHTYEHCGMSLFLFGKSFVDIYQTA